jgi:hypothetical protein
METVKRERERERWNHKTKRKEELLFVVKLSL